MDGCTVFGKASEDSTMNNILLETWNLLHGYELSRYTVHERNETTEAEDDCDCAAHLGTYK